MHSPLFMGLKTSDMVVGASISSATVFIIGDVNQLFIGLGIFIILDYITGMAAAFYEGKQSGEPQLSSRQGLWGLVRKSLVFVMVIMAHWLDVIMGNTDGFLRNGCIMLIMSNEGLSILENLGRMNFKIPKPLRDALLKLNEKPNDKDDHDEQ